MFDFAWPWMFIILPLPWLLYRYSSPAKQTINEALKVPFYPLLLGLTQQHKKSLTNQSYRKWLLILAWLSLVTATAGPQWFGDLVSVERTGRNIILAVDLSGSMEIEDMRLDGEPVDRLDVVKAVAKRFIAQRSEDRLGLILFGTRAYLQTPLTFDRQTVEAMLDDATIALPGPQTAIGDAIGLAVKHLREVPKGSRILVLLTDGVNNAGVLDPIQAAQLAAAYDIKIYTIGMGANQMLVPTLLGPQLINPSWDLDEQVLRHIANMTGGVSFRATDSEQLAQVYQSINVLEPESSEQIQFRPITPLYFWPLLLTLFISAVLVFKTANLSSLIKMLQPKCWFPDKP